MDVDEDNKDNEDEYEKEAEKEGGGGEEEDVDAEGEDYDEKEDGEGSGEEDVDAEGEVEVEVEVEEEEVGGEDEVDAEGEIDAEGDMDIEGEFGVEEEDDGRIVDGKSKGKGMDIGEDEVLDVGGDGGVKERLERAWSHIEEYAASHAPNSLVVVTDKINALFPKTDIFPNLVIIQALHSAIGKVFPDPDTPADLDSARVCFNTVYEMHNEVSSFIPPFFLSFFFSYLSFLSYLSRPNRLPMVWRNERGLNGRLYLLLSFVFVDKRKIQMTSTAERVLPPKRMGVRYINFSEMLKGKRISKSSM